jgi:predicted GNAT family N-acyltransferase
VEPVKLNAVTSSDWSELLDGEREPWGGVAEGLSWANKERHLAVRGADGRLLAVAGAGRADIEVAGSERFRVVGIGGVFVTRRERGRGLAIELLDRLLRLAAEMGPERAMLFCRPALSALYGKLGFAEIGAPVRAEQPGGPIEMPLLAMWRPLRAGVRWPDGPVEVRGLPF